MLDIGLAEIAPLVNLLYILVGFSVVGLVMTTIVGLLYSQNKKYGGTLVTSSTILAVGIVGVVTTIPTLMGHKEDNYKIAAEWVSATAIDTCHDEASPYLRVQDSPPMLWAGADTLTFTEQVDDSNRGIEGFYREDSELRFDCYGALFLEDESSDIQAYVSDGKHPQYEAWLEGFFRFHPEPTPEHTPEPTPNLSAKSEKTERPLEAPTHPTDVNVETTPLTPMSKIEIKDCQELLVDGKEHQLCKIIDQNGQQDD